MQALDHPLLPLTAPKDAPAVEVEHVHLVHCAEEEVVRVQVGMPDAARVQPSDTAADRAPARGVERLPAQRLREGQACRQLLGNEVGAVQGACPRVARGHRARYRQCPFGEPAQQPPLREGARARRAGPEIGVIEELRDQSAAPVMTQYPAEPAFVHEGHRTAPAGNFLERTSRAPELPLEELIARLVDARAIV
jgi:hypothetical protein